MSSDPSEKARHGRRRANDYRMLERTTRQFAYLNERPDDVTSTCTWHDRRGVRHVSMSTWENVFEARLASAVRRRDNRAPCSCFGCGNPRRHFGDLRMQEMRAAVSAECQMRDAGLLGGGLPGERSGTASGPVE